MTNLLPNCPKCGGVASVDWGDCISSKSKFVHWVYCTVCDLETTKFPSMQEAKEQWNRYCEEDECQSKK
jgi:hypothetical protein